MQHDNRRDLSAEIWRIIDKQLERQRVVTIKPRPAIIPAGQDERTSSKKNNSAR